MLLVERIQQKEKLCGYYLQLEKYYTCCIERRKHIHYNPASARLASGLLVFNA